MVTFVVVGAEAVANSFRVAVGNINAQKPAWMQQCGPLVKLAVEGEILADGLYRSGDLFGSGRVFGGTADGISVGFGQGLDYAEALERGARPHPITASRASNLKFYWKKAGMWFLGPSVQHPGNVPYRFARNGAFTSSKTCALVILNRLKAILS